MSRKREIRAVFLINASVANPYDSDGSGSVYPTMQRKVISKFLKLKLKTQCLKQDQDLFSVQSKKSETYICLISCTNTVTLK
jgi:hypothetical protein